MILALYTFSSFVESLWNPAQTIEEIDAHRQKEVLALVPYIIDAALRRDVPSVAAALVADLEENAAEERHKETEKTSRYTQTPMVDGTHGAGRCGGVCRAPADAGCPCAGSGRPLQAGHLRCHRLQAPWAHATRQGARASPVYSICARATCTEADSRVHGRWCSLVMNPRDEPARGCCEGMRHDYYCGVAICRRPC